MGTQIRVKMEELQSIFMDTKNMLASGGQDPSMLGREPADLHRKSRSSATSLVTDERELPDQFTADHMRATPRACPTSAQPD